MKKMIVAAVAACVTLSAFALDITALVPLKEDVRSYTVTEYSIATKFGDYFKTVTGKVSHVIDASGNDVESCQYSARGVLENTMRTTFDSMGNSLTSSLYNASDELISKSESVYKKGLKTETNDYDAEGNLRSKTIFKYEDGRMTDESGYDAKGDLIFKVIRAYDEEGRIVKGVSYFPDGSLDNERVLTYKENGKVESQTTRDSIEKTTQLVFRYNANDELVEITTYNVLEAGPKVVGRTIIKYDEKGNVSKISDYVIAEKFGTTVNELVYMADYSYGF